MLTAEQAAAVAVDEADRFSTINKNYRRLIVRLARKILAADEDTINLAKQFVAVRFLRAVNASKGEDKSTRPAYLILRIRQGVMEFKSKIERAAEKAARGGGDNPADKFRFVPMHRS